MAQFPLKNGLIQGTLDGTPTSGTLDLSSVTLTLPQIAVLNPSYLVIDEDFCFGSNADGDIGIGWRIYNLTGTGSTAGLVSSASGSGLFNVTSGATSGNSTCISMGLSGGTSIYNPCATAFRMTIRCALSASTSVQCLWGVTGDGSGLSGNATITNGIYIRANTGTDTNFTFCCTSGGSTTATASSVALDTSYHVFAVRRVSASSVAFSIDGGAETTIATNVPTGAMSPRFQAGTLTSASRTVSADYFKLIMTRS